VEALMSRRWAAALLCAYADVFTAVFWPGPINGMTVLFILAVDAVIAFVMLGLPPLRAANRLVGRESAEIDEAHRIRNAEMQLRRMTRGGL
jgi:hypothetical protein